MPAAGDLMRALDALADPEAAAFKQRFFKTGPGEYGEGDVFIGLDVPTVRREVKPFADLPLREVAKLLGSEIHEHRFAASVILTDRAKRHARKQDVGATTELYDFYLQHRAGINNWDIVDISCRAVVGGHLLLIGDPAPMTSLALEEVLWTRRIGIVSTWTFTRAGDSDPIFAIAPLVLDDPRDLTHKAVGWMLREAGIGDRARLERFLAEYAPTMPRTALRYSIEHFDPEQRKRWLAATQEATDARHHH